MQEFRPLRNRNISQYQIAEAETIISTNQLPYEIETVAQNLRIPWAMDISEEGKIYITERTGTVRILEDARLLPEPLITLRETFVSLGEGGLLGIALDPDFSSNHYIYLMHSYQQGNTIYNRVIRLIEKDNKATIDKVIIDNIPGSLTHNGGRIKIGPDKKLYIATGDAGNPNLSQNLSSTAGKILRLELDGSIPSDNPLANSPVYSYGHRNPQGLTWSTNQTMYATDHGQIAHDEVNLIIAGANYGWPVVEGDKTSELIKTQTPLVHSQDNTWAPSGIAYSNQGSWQNRLLVACLLGQQLLVFTLNPEGTGVEMVETFLWNEFGRLREVIVAEDGSIYLSTSNRDGRGKAESTDDRIIRLKPKSGG